ncbi:MAG: hypothetical protein DKM50_01645 [Candidatus Margulisiibacteriota bacterium]|nr:MAG: hypothetical protein A2X43_13500 [Candidatus Margulisbacteria bacterium GWD2_39_127]OGI04728.1 MAG: hypothetical protein A2X42_10495 [Candidatus Margulisbacteria bacterium GWF2_38_17]OGI05673.1 MAG: hypothetical protein A2X41_03080 [Candidatus Margulisbacteria bacterium GWE2_39_32]PZM83607.1 MAG: hypothetical protein DKM50_01645 [Candidatus Margulisiibacteriota bacterium]HAR62025.1 hypothetical protein [Candidatus Margulisiibacteriota bacterium]
MIKIILLIIFALSVAMIAKSKGYNMFFWFFFGFLFPPIPIIIILLLPRKGSTYFSMKYPGFNKETESTSGDDPLVQCIACGKMIPINASVCKYCGKKYDIIDTDNK